MSRETLEDSIVGRTQPAERMPAVRTLFSGGEIINGEPLLLLAGETGIGREPPSGGIRFADDLRMSRHHATIEVTLSGLYVRDEDSRNGTKVNGQPVTRRRIAPGDIIRIGDTCLHVGIEELDLHDSHIPQLVGFAPVMRDLRNTVAMLGRSSASVFITGETGAGKGVVAGALHDQSGRPGPFIAVNCGAVPAGLAESAFFGHKKGSFTGANRDHVGHFKQADGGTLFIDEIGELPAQLQAKLLHAAETHEVVPVGGSTPIRCDVRLISATNIDVLKAVASGQFRRDLYARLAEIEVAVPPLRQRREDVLLLLRQVLDRELPSLSPHLAEALLVYDWPLNVRQLLSIGTELNVRGKGQQRLELELIQSRLVTIDAEDLVPVAERSTLPGTFAPTRSAIISLLRAHRGVVKAAAKASGRSRRQFYRWIKQHQINPAIYR